MAATQASDVVFVPKVWSDHITAYFNKKLVFGAFALKNDQLTRSPGETVSFPYFKAIGDAEEPAENADLTVSALADDAFTATVKEVGKAVGFTGKSLRKSAADRDTIFDEAQNQMARVIAEKVDADIITEINSNGNYTAGLVGTAFATGACTAANLLTGRTLAFGDRGDEAEVIFMHSLHFLSMMKDSGAGFIKADANDPMYLVKGFMGRIFGAAVVVTDSVPAGGTVDGKKTFYSFTCKPKSYGFIVAEEIMFEQDRDILARQSIITATQWYAVKGFHGKVHADDKRVCRNLFVTEVAAA